MKKSIVLIALIVSAFAFNQAQAQVSVSVNIGAQPVWGPVGYDHADYYYMPDIEAYYDVPAHMYIYNEGGVWVHKPSLPSRYASFDLYHGYKVVLNERDPWLHHDVVRTKYATYKGHHDQAVIRDSHEQKYYVLKDHPEHSKYRAEPQHNQVVNHNGEKHDEHHDEHHEGHEHH